LGGKDSTRTLNELSGLKKIEFGRTDPHGLEWDGVVVTKVRDQALKLGVQPGWKIYMVDNQVVKSSDEVWGRLQEARWEWRSCNVHFITNIKAIRAEQAMTRERQIQFEVERLAKLPFQSSADDKHLEQLKEEFTFQGSIDLVEDRAITVVQLQRVITWVKAKCHRWRDTTPDSSTAGKKLDLGFMDMYHLHHWLIEPATKEKNCSMVELLTSQQQTASWCCIVWWGCRFEDLRKCLKQELQTRSLPADITYFWLGAFANRPHSPSDTSGADPRATCFHKALLAARFKTFLVLDKKEEHTGPALTYKRLWCDYEMLLCFNDAPANLVLDIAICDENQRPAVITMGLTPDEANLDLANAKDEKNAAAGFKAKADREKSLDLIYVERALATRVETALTTVPYDRTRLLNIIAGRELALPPLEKCPSYVEANQKIVSRCMLVFWRRVMAGASADNDTLRLQTQLVDAIRSDTSLQSLDLSLAFMVPGGDEKLPLLSRCFPPNLRSLKLDLRELGLTNDGITTLVNSLPRDLEELKLDLGRNDQIDNFGIEAMVNRLPPKVHIMSLGLEGTSVSPEMQAKRESLEGIKQFIQEENEKGNTCIIYSLCPSANRRMIPQTTKCKVFPPEK
jgi:hypothetical protein